MHLALIPSGAVPSGSFESLAQFEAEAGASAASILIVDLEARHPLGNPRMVDSLMESPLEAVVGLATAQCRSAEMRFRQTALRLRRRGWRIASGEAGLDELRSIVNSIVRSECGDESLVLTDRQQQVLHLVASGMSNSEIGERLKITTGTVKRHIHDCFERLGASTRLDVIIRAHQLGIIETVPELAHQVV